MNGVWGKICKKVTMEDKFKHSDLNKESSAINNNNNGKVMIQLMKSHLLSYVWKEIKPFIAVILFYLIADNPCTV